MRWPSGELQLPQAAGNAAPSCCYCGHVSPIAIRRPVPALRSDCFHRRLWLQGQGGEHSTGSDQNNAALHRGVEEAHGCNILVTSSQLVRCLSFHTLMRRLVSSQQRVRLPVEMYFCWHLAERNKGSCEQSSMTKPRVWQIFSAEEVQSKGGLLSGIARAPQMLAARSWKMWMSIQR